MERHQPLGTASHHYAVLLREPDGDNRIDKVPPSPSHGVSFGSCGSAKLAIKEHLRIVGCLRACAGRALFDVRRCRSRHSGVPQAQKISRSSLHACRPGPARKVLRFPCASSLVRSTPLVPISQAYVPLTNRGEFSRRGGHHGPTKTSA
jgi:hypothetical protein